MISHHIARGSYPIKDVVGHQDSLRTRCHRYFGHDIFAHVYRVVVDVAIEGSGAFLFRPNVTTQPKGFPFLEGAILALHAVPVIHTNVVAISAVVVVAQDFHKAAGITRAEVVLDDHIVAVVINVTTGGISRPGSVGERVVFDQHVGAAPGPQTAAPTPFAAIVAAARTVHPVATDVCALDPRHLYPGTSSRLHHIVQNLHIGDPRKGRRVF